MEYLTFPKGGIIEDADEFYRKLDEINYFYSQQNIKDKIDDIIESVYQWLLENNQRTDDYFGSTDDDNDQVPWFPEAIWEYTVDKDRLDIRYSTLRSLIFMNGMSRTIRLIIDSKILRGQDVDAYIAESTDRNSQGIFEELISSWLSGNPKRRISVEDVKQRMGFAYGTNIDKVRSRQVVRMTHFGLWTATPKPKRECEIAIGPVAVPFFHDVFSKLRVEFEGRISGTMR
jgi:hypothetical protein